MVCAIVTPIVALLLAFLILCFVTMGMYTPVFLKRVLFHWDSSVNDYKIFSERLVAKGENPYVYQKAENPAIGEITIAYSGKEKILNDFIGSTQTTSFIVAKNDRIVYEKYADGYDENSVNTSFSMAKSIVSLLVGKAIEKGAYSKRTTADFRLYYRISKRRNRNDDDRRIASDAFKNRIR